MVLDTRQRLLDAALRLIRDGGFQAVSIAAVSEEAGLGKSPVYTHFGSKHALVEAALEQAGQQFVQVLEQRLEASEDDPECVVEAMFAVLEEWLAERGAIGCPFVVAAGELGPRNDEVRHLCSDQKQRVMSALERRLAATGVEEAPAVAFDVMLLAEGATVLDTVGGETTAADRAYRTALRLL